MNECLPERESGKQESKPRLGFACNNDNGINRINGESQAIPDGLSIILPSPSLRLTPVSRLYIGHSQTTPPHYNNNAPITAPSILTPNAALSLFHSPALRAHADPGEFDPDGVPEDEDELEEEEPEEEDGGAVDVGCEKESDVLLLASWQNCCARVSAGERSVVLHEDNTQDSKELGNLRSGQKQLTSVTLEQFEPATAWLRQSVTQVGNPVKVGNAAELVAVPLDDMLLGLTVIGITVDEPLASVTVTDDNGKLLLAALDAPDAGAELRERADVAEGTTEDCAAARAEESRRTSDVGRRASIVAVIQIVDACVVRDKVKTQEAL